MGDEKDIDLDFALKYFVNYKEKPDHVDFEHTYSQPCHKKYFNGFSNPAKYLFTVPTPNTISDGTIIDEYVDIETVDHNPPLYFDTNKLSEQLEKTEYSEYEDNWADKIDKKDWNIIKVRMFKSAIQILEFEYLARLAYKGQRDEAVKRNLITKKTALRFKSLYSSVAWDSPTCQWLHGLLLKKCPSCLMKVYTDAFQCLETKVPSHLLENMTISTSYMSVRSRLSGLDSLHNSQKKHRDMFESALSQHHPGKIFGDPLLVLLPTNLGNPLEPNTRPFRFVSELSLLGTLITVTCCKESTSLEISTLLDVMISSSIKKIIELQSEYPDRVIVLIGVGPAALFACHIAMRFKQKVAAIISIGFNIFSVEGKITKTNEKLLSLKTPILFVIGQNATTATVDEIEEFRFRLKCKSGLLVVGGADDHLRVNHFLKMKCAVTQSIVDRCIVKEISEFLNDIMQPSKVLVSILSNSENIENKAPSSVPTINAQFLKKIIEESKNNPNSPIIKEITSTLAQLQSEQKYSNIPSTSETSDADKDKKNELEEKRFNDQFNSTEDLITLKKVLTSKDPPFYNRNLKQYNRAANHNQFSAATQYQLTKVRKRMAELNNQNSPSPVNLSRKTRGGRRPYVRRTMPPKRPSLNSKMTVVSSYLTTRQVDDNVSQTNSSCNGGTTPNVIENITPDSLLDMPVVFADENDDENVINDVSLTSYQPK